MFSLSRGLVHITFSFCLSFVLTSWVHGVKVTHDLLAWVRIRTCDTTSSQSSSEVIADRRLRWRVLVALLERPAPYRRERQCRRGFWEVICGEMWIRTLRMAGATFDGSCDAVGPPVAFQSHFLLINTTCDQVPPHASNMFVLGFLKYFLLTQFPYLHGCIFLSL